MNEVRDAWMAALQHSCQTLRSLVEPLSAETLQRQSYDTEWSVAQVMSHLGSQGTIFERSINAGLNGEAPLGREQFEPIWDEWNAKTPEQQATDALDVDRNLLLLLTSLNGEGSQNFQLEAFGMQLGPADFARLRLSEHAVHTWDIAVPFDPGATVSNDAVEILIDQMTPLVEHRGRPDGPPRRVIVETEDPARRFSLDVGKSLALTVSHDDAPPQLRIPAEGFLRLVYGRLDPAHTPPLTADGVDLDELRRMFPGL